MASYNKLDGAYATENRRLLEDILKGEWGYDGVVVSDWGAVHATAAGGQRRLDLEMPGPARLVRRQAGWPPSRPARCPTARIDDAARRLVRLILRTGVARREPQPDGELRSDRHRADRRARAAEEAIVLLKNDGELLPLDAGRHQDHGRGRAERQRSSASRAAAPRSVSTDRWPDAGVESLGARLPTAKVLYAAGRRRRAGAAAGAGAHVQPDRGARARPASTAEYFADARLRAAQPLPHQTTSGALLQLDLDHGLAAAANRLRRPALERLVLAGARRRARVLRARRPGAAGCVVGDETVIDFGDAGPGGPHAIRPAPPALRRTGAVELEAGRGYPLQPRIPSGRRRGRARLRDAWRSACASRQASIEDGGRRGGQADTRRRGRSARPRRPRSKAMTARHRPAGRTEPADRAGRRPPTRAPSWW